LFLLPSTPRGLPAPRSNAAARSRNSQQSTQRLSIRDEGGYRFTARVRGACGSSFLADLSLGRMLQIHDVPRLCRGAEDSAARVRCAGSSISNEGNRSTNGPVSSARFSVGQCTDTPAGTECQRAQAPGRSSQSNRRIARLAQRRPGALKRQERGSAGDRGLAVKRLQLDAPG